MIMTMIYFAGSYFVLAPLAEPEESFGRWFVFGQAVPNVFSLPLVYISSLCEQVEIPRPEKLLLRDATESNSTEEEFLSESECKALSELYVLLYSTLVCFFIFSAGLQYASRATKDFSIREVEVIQSSPKSVEEALKSTKENLVDPEVNEAEVKSIELSVAEDENQVEQPKHSLLGDLILSLKRPANVAMLLGICVGISEPVQDFLFGNDAPLGSVSSGIQVVSSGTVSFLNIIMGCTLSLKVKSLTNKMDVFGSKERVGATSRTLLTYAVGRMVVFPALALGAFLLLEDVLFVDDKLLKLSTFLCLPMPTANLIVALAQLAGQQRNAEILAIVGLLQFLFGVFTISTFIFVSLLSLDLA